MPAPPPRSERQKSRDCCRSGAGSIFPGAVLLLIVLGRKLIQPNAFVGKARMLTLPEPDAGPTSVFGDELKAGSF